MALRALAGGLIFAEITGTGRPEVLALHGWARRGSDLRAAVEGFSAISPDLPGFGASPAPDRVAGAADYAEMLLPILDEFESPPVVLGHSFGGRVAVCLAVAHPERVGPLILTGVPLLRLGSASVPSAGFRLIRSLNRMGLISDERMESERRKRGSADYRAATGVMRDILVKVVNESYEGEMGRLQSPVTLIWGAHDGEVPVEVAVASRDLLAAGGAEVTLTVLDGVGHMTQIEAPGSLRESILEALP